MKGYTRAGSDGMTSVFDKSVWYLFLLEDRIAPPIHDDPSREELGARSLSDTQDGVSNKLKVQGVIPPPSVYAAVFLRRPLPWASHIYRR
jgi:hypothetical protein